MIRAASSGWNLLFTLAIVAIVGLLGFHFGFPEKSTVKPIASDLKMIDDVTKKAHDKASSLMAESLKSTWDLDAERLGTRTLAVLTDLSDKHKLKLSGFRIEKSPEVANLQQATYVVVLDGPFLAITEVLKTLEDPQSKLVVGLFQVSSSDPDSDRVTATISLIGFSPAKPDQSVAVAWSVKS